VPPEEETLDSIWNTTDYRAFLRQWLEEERVRRPVVTGRWLAQRLAMDPSILSKILASERHLAHSRIQPVCDILKLPPDQTEYFRLLVHYGKAKGHREAQACFAKMAELRRVSPSPLDDVQVAYWESWIHVALRSLLKCGDFRDEWERIGSLLRPRQSARRVREAMLLLERIGLAWKDDGIWRTGDGFLKDGSPAQAPMVRHYHRQALLLGLESIEAVPKDRRDLSCITVSVPFAEYPRIVEMVRDFRSRLLSAVSGMNNPDCVYQLSLQLVPLALTEKTNAE